MKLCKNKQIIRTQGTCFPDRAHNSLIIPGPRPTFVLIYHFPFLSSPDLNFLSLGSCHVGSCYYKTGMCGSSLWSSESGTALIMKLRPPPSFFITHFNQTCFLNYNRFLEDLSHGIKFLHCKWQTVVYTQESMCNGHKQIDCCSYIHVHVCLHGNLHAGIMHFLTWHWLLYTISDCKKWL